MHYNDHVRPLFALVDGMLYDGCWILGFTGSWWNHKCGSTKASRSVEDGYPCTHYVEASTCEKNVWMG